MQSDQFHYLHHRFFECNYGTPTFPLDVWFGTFRESLDPKSSMYKGEHIASKENKMNLASAQRADSKATLWGRPNWDELTYNVLCNCCFPAVVALSFLKYQGIEQLAMPAFGLTNGMLLGLLLSVGPMLTGALLLLASTRKPFTRLKYTFMYPFHKEALFGAFGLNTVVGLLVTALPVYHTVQMFLSPEGKSAYHFLYGH